jgi:FolB domain-containing protein
MKIGIKNLQINCTIGLLDEEKINKQDIYLDITVESSFVDYVKIAELATSLATHQHYELLENLTQDIIEEMHNSFDVSWACVKIKKPQAIKTAEYAFVEQEQSWTKT